MPALSDLPRLTDPAVLQDILPALDQIRDSQPVYRIDELNFTLVSRHEDVMRVLKDPETFSSKAYAEFKSRGISGRTVVEEVLSQGYPYVDTLSETDGLRHRFHRSIVKRFLSRERLANLTPSIENTVDELLTSLETSEVDIVRDFTAPLAIRVMCEFVGVPASDAEIFLRGSDGEVALLGSADLPEDEELELAKAFLFVQTYVDEQIKLREGTQSNDFISTVISSTPPDGCEPLTASERNNLIRTIIMAGNETTRSLIGSALLRLSRSHELQAAMRNDPNKIPTFLEEVLRLDSPVILLYRVTTREIELSGTMIGPGERIAVCYATANHDDSVHSDPMELDLSREQIRDHVGFGWGVHLCAGAPLARLEARIAVEEFVKRFHFSLSQDAVPTYLPTFIVHNLTALPLTISPIAAGVPRT